jgi:hypothetical protein
MIEKKYIYYNKDSVLIHIEWCDILSDNYLKNINFTKIYKINPKYIFLNLPPLQENIFFQVCENMKKLYIESWKKIIPIINDYGVGMYCINNEIPYMMGRILGTQYLQSSNCNNEIQNVDQPFFLWFVFDNFLFLFTLKNKIFQKILEKKYLTIFLGFDNFLSASHECKFTDQEICKFECRQSNNNISLLLETWYMKWKNLYLQSSSTTKNNHYTYIFS